MTNVEYCQKLLNQKDYLIWIRNVQSKQKKCSVFCQAFKKLVKWHWNDQNDTKITKNDVKWPGMTITRPLFDFRSVFVLLSKWISWPDSTLFGTLLPKRMYFWLLWEILKLTLPSIHPPTHPFIHSPSQDHTFLHEKGAYSKLLYLLLFCATYFLFEWQIVKKSGPASSGGKYSLQKISSPPDCGLKLAVGQDIFMRDKINSHFTHDPESLKCDGKLLQPRNLCQEKLLQLKYIWVKGM